jgi:hypothetical protein
MNPQDLARLETEAAEIIGAVKELFKEFENRLGEVVSVQRIAASESRAEGARAIQQLHELAVSARELAGGQRQLLTRIERDWQLHIDGNAQRAGEAQAKAFGESIAQGLHDRLAELANQVERITRRLSWKVVLGWALGIAIAIPLSISVGVQTFAPSVEKLSVEGLTPEQTRDALSRVARCRVNKNDWRDWHVCVAVDDSPRLTKGPGGEALVILRGM